MARYPEAFSTVITRGVRARKLSMIASARGCIARSRARSAATIVRSRSTAGSSSSLTTT